MTDTSPVSPQSATAPAETNVKRDEYSSIFTTEYEATADQRVIGIGNSIPLVFCRYADGIGGAWVTPPAGRYGTTENSRDGDSFAFGLVISDGQIGSIAATDIYKGAQRLDKFAGYGSTFKYGGMPESGYDYTIKFVAPGDPAIPGTPGYWTPSSGTQSWNWEMQEDGRVRSASVARCTQASISYNYDGANTWGIAVRVTVYVNGSLVAQSASPGSWGSSTRPWTWSGTFGVGTLEVRSEAYNNSFIGSNGRPQNTHILTISYQNQVWNEGKPEIPATPDEVSNLPLFPGSGGNYAGMSCLAAKGRYAPGGASGTFRQQIRCFVREGLHVTRVLGGSGPSNLYPDLVYYLLGEATRAGTRLVDMPSFQAAAQFCNAQSLFFNGVMGKSVNLREYLGRVSPLFLLGFVQDQGKYYLKPLLPLTSNHQISSSTVPITHRFTKDEIVVGSYRKDYVDSSKREPFCALMTWRSQQEAVFGVSKSTEVRYKGEAVDGPYEQYDMEEFCTTQEHAVLVGRFILAGRKYSSHLVTFQAIKNIPRLGPLDFIEVEWAVDTTLGGFNSGIETYQVQTITESAEGLFSITAAHFPVNSDGQSLIGRDTVSADFEIK